MFDEAMSVGHKKPFQRSVSFALDLRFNSLETAAPIRIAAGYARIIPMEGRHKMKTIVNPDSVPMPDSANKSKCKASSNAAMPKKLASQRMGKSNTPSKPAHEKDARL